MGEEKRRGSGCHHFKWGQGKAACPINSSLSFSLSWRQPLLTAFVFPWHSVAAGPCLVSKECLCFVFPQGGQAERGRRLAKAGWGRTAQSLEAGASGAGRAWRLCVQHRNSISSMRGEGGLRPFVICCRWCQRLWLKISGWLVRQLAD